MLVGGCAGGGAIMARTSVPRAPSCLTPTLLTHLAAAGAMPPLPWSAVGFKAAPPRGGPGMCAGAWNFMAPPGGASRQCLSKPGLAAALGPSLRGGRGAVAQP